MSTAWAKAARGLGDTLLQVGMMNQRERMESQRQANLDRIRSEDRAFAAGVRAEERDYQEGVRGANIDQNRKFMMEDQLQKESFLEDKTNNDNEQKRLDRESREKIAGMKIGNSLSGSGGAKSKVTMGFVLKTYGSINDQIGSLANDIRKIEANEDFLPAEEVKQLVSDKKATAFALRDRLRVLYDLNPEIHSIVGDNKEPTKIDRKSEDAMLSEAHTDFADSLKPEVKAPLAVADNNPPKTQEKTKILGSSQGLSLPGMGWLEKTKGQVGDFMDKVSNETAEQYKESAGIIEKAGYSDLSLREQRGWLFKNKDIIGRKRYNQLIEANEKSIKKERNKK